MAVLRTKLRELRNADVRFISLVDRAASRIPFRVLKRDKEPEMGIDLMKVFKGERVKPEIAAVVVFAQQDADVAEQVRQSIAGAGLDTSTVRKADNDTTVVFPQKDVKEDETVMVRLSDQMLVTATGIEPLKGLYGAVVEKNGFVPDLPMAMEIFHAAVQEAVLKAEHPQTTIKAAYDSLGQYLQVMATLPTAVYKADEAVRGVAVKDDEPANDGTKLSNPDNNPATKEVPGLQPGATSVETESGEDADVDLVKDADTPASTTVPTTSTTKKTDKVEKSDRRILDAIAGIQTEMRQGIQKLTTKVDAVASEQGRQKKVLDDVVQKAETLDSKLKTTIAAPPQGEDRPSGERVIQKKQDDDPRTGNFDTAFLRRRNR